METETVLTEKDERPRIYTQLVRDPETGEVSGAMTTLLVPGKIIERCGKKYEIQNDGSQRRVR